MGTYVFLTAVFIEIILASVCIITKSNQKKIRSITRISAFIVFALLSSFSVIDWGLIYYAVAVLLLALTVIAIINLIRKKEDTKAYRASRTVLKSIGMIFLIFILMLPAILFPEYKGIEPTGKYKVSTVTYSIVDKNRIETYTNTGENRKLNVEMWYPQNVQGTYPLVIFSHGSFGVKSSNESLYNELASHGYVVCSIDHTYQCFFTTDTNGNTISMDSGFRKEIAAEDAKTNKQQSYEYYQKWMKIRTGDINFVIDYILSQAKNSNTDAVYKLVDITKIGVMGHSLGGSAALGIGRMRNDVKAVIALESPFMYDIQGVKNNQFIFNNDDYPLPVLNVYSDSAWEKLSQLPQYAENYQLLSNHNNAAFNVHIRGVGHLSLTDFAITSPILTDIMNGKISTTDTKYCLKTINKVCLEFFDCYLKGQGKFDSRVEY